MHEEQRQSGHCPVKMKAGTVPGRRKRSRHPWLKTKQQIHSTGTHFSTYHFSFNKYNATFTGKIQSIFLHSKPVTIFNI